jgi:hypothetical protein
MKIRKVTNRYYQIIPKEGTRLRFKYFKYKKDLINYLTTNFRDCVNAEVCIYKESFGASFSEKNYMVWYNRNEYRNGAFFKAKLHLIQNKGRRYISKLKTSKRDKRWFSFSEKIISLMCYISDELHKGNPINKSNAKNLVILFKKRGFVDFEPSEEDLEYINGYIGQGIDFFHWSDRCDFLRMKTVIEYFKREGLIDKTLM